MKPSVIIFGATLTLLTLSGCAPVSIGEGYGDTGTVVPSPSSSYAPGDSTGSPSTDTIAASLLLGYSPDALNQDQPGNEQILHTLECNLDGTAEGSFADPAGSCSHLAKNKDLYLKAFDSTAAKDTLCTKIYGGPESLDISGVIDGKSVEITLNRIDGCKIDEWDAWEPSLLNLLIAPDSNSNYSNSNDGNDYNDNNDRK